MQNSITNIDTRNTLDDRIMLEEFNQAPAYSRKCSPKAAPEVKFIVEVPAGTSCVVNSGLHSIRGRAQCVRGWRKSTSGPPDSLLPRTRCLLAGRRRTPGPHRPQVQASVEKTGAVRRGQNRSIADSCVPGAGVLGPAGNRAPAASPHLEFMTALLRTILRDGERWRQK